MKIAPLLTLSVSLNLALGIGLVWLIDETVSGPVAPIGQTAMPSAVSKSESSASLALAKRSRSVLTAAESFTPAPGRVPSAQALFFAPQFTTPPSSVPATESSPADDPAIVASLGKKRTVNPVTPGNFLRFRGMHVALAETYQSPESSGRSLGVDVTPAITPGTNDARTVANTPPTVAAINPDLSSTTVADSQSFSSKDRLDSSPKTGLSTSNSLSASATAAGKDDGFGFTREEELFRMKWGWAAFDAARAESVREAGKVAP